MSADIQAITMPKWGLAMEEGKVVAWETGEGEAVAAGQEILEIETTKITNVFESPAGGLLRRCVVQEGETVPVGALLAVVAPESVPEVEIDAFIERFQAEFAVAAEAAAEAAPEPEIVSVGAHQINFLKTGAGEGPPIVLIHGFGGDLNNWLFTQPDLSEGHVVYALDLPGHGRSSKALGDAGIGVMVEALTGFLDSQNVEAAHLVGHSMGGAVALLLAIKQPGRVASITLVAPGGLGPEINMDFIGGFVAAGRRKEMKSVLELLVADPSLISRDMVNDVLKYKRLDGVETSLRALAESIFPDGRQQGGLVERLSGLSVPTQAIWGRADKVVPPGHAEALPASVEVHLLDGVGHMPHMEASAEVNRLIADFASA